MSMNVTQSSDKPSSPSPFPHLLLDSTCATPIQSDIALVKQFITDKEAELQSSETELAAALRRVKQLKERSQEIRTTISAHKWIISCIRRIPCEILAYIFFLAIPLPHERTQRPHPPRISFVRGSPWTTSATCRQWRSVCLSSPSLWSQIIINICNDDYCTGFRSSDEGHFIKSLRIQAERSSQFDLDVVVEDISTRREYAPGHRGSKLVAELSRAPLRCRIRSLHAPVELMEELYGEFRSLTQLHATHTSSLDTFLENHYHGRARPVFTPILETRFTRPLQELTDLTLGRAVHLNDILELVVLVRETLKHLNVDCRNLGFCDEDVAWMPGDNYSTSITLRELKALTIRGDGERCARFLNLILTPSLQSITGYPFSYFSDSIAAIANLVQRSACVLTSLRLDGNFIRWSKPSVSQLLSSSTLARHLRFLWINNVDCDPGLILDAIRCSQSITEGTTQPESQHSVQPLYPSLDKVTLHSLGGIQMESLVKCLDNVITSRRDGQLCMRSLELAHTSLYDFDEDVLQSRLGALMGAGMVVDILRE